VNLTVFEVLWPRVRGLADKRKLDLIELLTLELGKLRETLLGFGEPFVLHNISRGPKEKCAMTCLLERKFKGNSMDLGRLLVEMEYGNLF